MALPYMLFLGSLLGAFGLLPMIRCFSNEENELMNEAETKKETIRFLKKFCEVFFAVSVAIVLFREGLSEGSAELIVYFLFLYASLFWGLIMGMEKRFMTIPEVIRRS
jgi:hypothetical protein